MGIITTLFEKRTTWGPEDDHWYSTLGKKSNTGLEVSEVSALTYSAIWACVRVIAETCASLPLNVYQRLAGGGKRKATDHPLYYILHYQPNSEMTSMQFRESLIAHLLLWGNAYAEIERANNNVILGLWPLRPDRMEVKRRDSDNSIYYHYTPTDPKDKTRDYDPREILHIAGLGSNGLTGYSVVSYAREAIGMGLALEEFGARFFENNASPGGIIKLPNALKDEEAVKRLKASWYEAVGTLKNAHKVAVLENGAEWQAMGLPMKDAQFIEGRKFQVEEICRIYRVPPPFIQDHTHSTFSNIEHLSIDFVVHTIRPWLVRIEQAIQAKLIPYKSQEEFFAEHVVDGLLRGDIASRYSAYATGRQWGWLSADDIRELENQNPLPEGQGKVYLIPQNMYPADKIDEMVEAQKQKPKQPFWKEGTEPQYDEEGKEKELKTNQELLIKTYRPLFEDVSARIVRREKIAVERAMRRNNIEDFQNYLDGFYNELPEFISKNMMPVLKSYESQTGNNSLDERMNEYIAFHLHDSSQEIGEFVSLKKSHEPTEFSTFVNSDLATWETMRTQRMAGFMVDRIVLGSS